ncbi:MAG: intermembrane phospholipid transport protein YdbH family protein, partial [Sphingosinicella sp.]|uniref:intermembrane phospholipid transport protein YdbH family protein n=1 Tax=Sphingosinicella sp. TaxID=1917971 RepID=UPI004037C82D
MLRRALLGLLVLLLIAFAILWSMRERLAIGYIEGELERRDVRASYEVTRIGFGTQILENLVIGDPARPDATARRVEVQILIGLTGPRIGLIRARGVRLFGRVIDGRVSFGDVDRLLPPPSGEPFSLPDQRVDLDDAGIGIVTPAGLVAAGLSGRGNLADGFAGHVVLLSRQLRLGECALEGPRASLAVRIDDGSPTLAGPAAMRSLVCGNSLAVERPRLALDATLTPALDAWRGNGALRLGSVKLGADGAAGLEGRLTFAGTARETRGRAALVANGAEVAAFDAGWARFEGDYAVSAERGALALDGDLQAEGLALDEAGLASIAGGLRATRGTPLGPIGEALAGAVDRAGRGGAGARTRLRLAGGAGRGEARLSQFLLTTSSGARLRGDGGLAFSWPDGAMRLDGDFALSGGGFPDARFALRQDPGAPLEGTGRIAPMQAGGARLALGEIAFSGAGGRTRFRTVAALDGPFSGGRVEGLALPLQGSFGRGGFALGEGCVTGGFRALQVQNLRLGPSRLPLCPAGRALLWQDGGGLRGGAELRGPRFAGRLGSSPITLAGDQVRIDLNGFTASGLAARLGGASGANRLDIAHLDGRFGAGGVAGDFAGLSGDLANVPLLVGEGRGGWRFAGGTLDASGHIQVADKRDPVRFHPLVSDDFRLTLAGNRLRAEGWLAHPASGTRVTRATIAHDLASGAGNAVLDVPSLRFAGDFQPDTLTPLTVGVVALVDANVTGEGRIEWDASGTRSSGTFSTAGADLAAPFGPVEGLTTTIRFTDLLGLVSAPGQEASVDLVRAGIDVYDGEIRYQLRPNYHVAVESAHWPFAGGKLHLEPTMLDFSRETTKYLTFRVEGLDAARFIEQMDFSNIAATGTFDGIVPMQFDENGAGQILNGRLRAREEGGTLSYVGELTDRDLGPYGILAFNALKSLRYNRFDLTLNGALDGEFITVIDLDGVARDPALTTLPSGGGITQLVARRVFGQIARIPFEFNIRIQGQFRSLIATARSFNDPTPLIQAALPQMLREPANTIQDGESEPVQGDQRTGREKAARRAEGTCEGRSVGC